MLKLKIERKKGKRRQFVAVTDAPADIDEKDTIFDHADIDTIIARSKAWDAVLAYCDEQGMSKAERKDIVWEWHLDSGAVRTDWDTLTSSGPESVD